MYWCNANVVTKAQHESKGMLIDKDYVIKAAVNGRAVHQECQEMHVGGEGNVLTAGSPAYF